MKTQPKDAGQEELLKEITALLTKENIPYMITGSVSVIFYGRPRASHDIDFIIEGSLKDLAKIQNAFGKLPHKEFIADQHLIETALLNKMQFNVLHLPTMLKLDFWILQDTKFDKERFKRKKMIDIFGQQMSFASPEDTILIKLLWYKESKIEKHLIDAAFIYQLQSKGLEHEYLNKWAKKHKTVKLLEELEIINLVEHY
jgi:hypothetical protein